MRLINAKINQSYIVVKLHTKDPLRQRLMSFGIIKGASVVFLHHTKLKNTYNIQIGNTSMALRENEVQAIEIETEIE